jgi:Kef-type K+ transport system membrane component KefB
MVPELDNPQIMSGQNTAESKHVKWSGAILRATVLVVALCAFISLLRGFLFGEKWEASLLVFALASFALTSTARTGETPRAARGTGPVTAWWQRLPDWPLVSYCIIVGLGFNWACAFLWFSRRHAFFSTPVIGATAVTEALYAGIGFLVARLTGRNWRTALLFSHLYQGPSRASF